MILIFLHLSESHQLLILTFQGVVYHICICIILERFVSKVFALVFIMCSSLCRSETKNVNWLSSPTNSLSFVFRALWRTWNVVMQLLVNRKGRGCSLQVRRTQKLISELRFGFPVTEHGEKKKGECYCMCCQNNQENSFLSQKIMFPFLKMERQPWKSFC